MQNEPSRLSAIMDATFSSAAYARLSHALAPWARWVLATQSGQTPRTPVVAMKAAKGWGRSVIGKWSARSFERVQLGPAVHPGWHVEPGWDHDHQVPGTLLDLAGTRWWVAETGTPLSELAAVMDRLPQVLVNVRGVDKSRAAEDEAVQAAVAEAEARLGETGRVLLRPSGTEPVVRVMVEAPDEETAGREAQVLADVVQRELRLHD